MSLKLVFLFLLAGAIVLIVGPRASRNETVASTRESHPVPPILRTSGGAPLTSSADVSVRDGVALALHITNTTDRAVEINFPSGATHDFVVVDSTGREVWRWSVGRLFTQAIQNKLLGAHETITFEERWNAPSGTTGQFTLIAQLKSSNHPLEQHVAFTLR